MTKLEKTMAEAAPVLESTNAPEVITDQKLSSRARFDIENVLRRAGIDTLAPKTTGKPPPSERKPVPKEQVLENASLTDNKERLQKAKELLDSLKLPKQQESKIELITPEGKFTTKGKAIIEAHKVGKAGVYKYSFGEIREKTRILREAGFNEAQTRLLLESGLAGEVEIVELIEKTRQKESEPQYWMVRLQELDDLPADERQVRRDEYDKACQRLHDFSMDNKVTENNPGVTILEKQLIDFEQEEIEKGGRTQTEKEELQTLLDNLEKQENELIRVRNSLELKEQAPDFFTKREWKELEEREAQLRTDPDVGIDALKAEIHVQTTLGFLVKREELKTDISAAKERIEEGQKQQKLQELKEQRSEPDQWVRNQESRLLHDERPVLRESPDSMPSFNDVLDFFNKEQELKDAGDPDFWSEGYNRAKEALSWYFHEAREQGILSDGLETTLNKKYQEWANDLMSHKEVSPYDGSVHVVQKTFTQIQDEIIEYFDSLLDSKKPQYIEHESRWKGLQRHGVSAPVISRLKGIRGELVRRAQSQIEDSLLNLDQELRGELIGLTPIKRISGEWSVHKLEKVIRESRDKQEAQERSAPLFRHESYYSIDLIGWDRESIERGADQAADYIIGSATTFSLEVVRQRMELLTQGLEKKIGVIEASEKVSRKEATAIVHEIQRAATNKLDFFILDWTAQNLLMDQFAGYYSDRMRMDGDQKLKTVPAMNDGLAGLTIHWLNSPLYRLYYRPQGFKGQLFNDDQTHKTMRGLMREQIIQKLMEYELKGRDFREKAQNREKLKFGPTIHEYLQQFNRKGVIPEGIIPDEVIEEYFRYTGRPVSKDTTTEFFNRLSIDDRVYLFTLLTPQQQAQLFDALKINQRVEIRQKQYELILRETKAKGNAATFEDLAEVRETAKRLAEEKNFYQVIRSKAESAFDTADKVMNIFGDAAVLGAPSIIMENGPDIKGPDGQTLKRGDFISINDYVLVQKYAILQAGKKLTTFIGSDGKQYSVDDNLALIRYRSKEWIKRWKAAGFDRSKASRNFEMSLPDGNKITVNLAQGFEETGLTEDEWQAFVGTANKLRKDGYETVIDGKKFEDIIKMDELQPVLNNFLADYKSSESEINDPDTIAKAARGKMFSIANIRKRLGFTGRKKLEGTTQQQIDEYTQRIEDSRSFHHELERLAYFEATHDLNNKIGEERGKPIYKFSADRVDYGYQRLSWGVKRLHHIKAFWYTNLRRTVPRAVDLVHAVPIALSSLVKEHSFDSFLQMCWDINKMESIDNPGLVMTGDRHKDQADLRGRGEGTVSEGQGGLKKMWGFWEKPLVDANALWKSVSGIISSVGTRESLRSLVDDPDTLHLGPETAEQLVDAVFEALGRIEPLLIATEKSLGEGRQALSAGTGYDENEKFMLRFMEWLMSGKQGEGREQGGMITQQEISDIMKLITKPGTFKPGAVYFTDKKGNEFIDLEKSPSIWEEVVRKITPSHNPRIIRTVVPNYTVVM